MATAISWLIQPTDRRTHALTVVSSRLKENFGTQAHLSVIYPMCYNESGIRVSSQYTVKHNKGLLVESIIENQHLRMYTYILKIQLFFFAIQVRTFYPVFSAFTIPIVSIVLVHDSPG